MGLVLPMILLLLKLCIIGFAFAVQGSKGLDIPPSPAVFLVVPPIQETPGPVQHGKSRGSIAPSSQSDPDGFVISPSPATLPVLHSPARPASIGHSWGAIAPNSPAVPTGSFLRPPVSLLPPTSAPIPQKTKGAEPFISPSPSTITLSPPLNIVPSPTTVEGHVPSAQPTPPQRELPAVKPRLSSPAIPAPIAPSANLPINSPLSQPTQHKSLSPDDHERNASKSHIPEPISPASIAIPSANLPRNSPERQPTEHGSLPSALPRRNANSGHIPKPISQAPVAIPPVILPKISPVSQPTEHKSLPPSVHKSNASNPQWPEPALPVPVASPPWKEGPPMGQPKLPKLTPSILPAPVTSPPSGFPVNPPPVLPIRSAASPSVLQAPTISPASKGGAPATAPLYKTPKPLPAVVHFPAGAPAAHKAVRQIHHAPAPSIPPSKAPFNIESNSSASSPSTSFDKDNHTRNTITGPAPASSYLVSPPTTKHQDQAIPPSLLPTSGQRHDTSPPMGQVSPSSFPILSPRSQISPTPSTAKVSPPASKTSPSGSQKKPKTPILPQIQTLPPPPPNEDCLSTVCREPYTNSPPGSPCACVLPMKVGLRLSVSLYTFFPLVSELASEIANGVFVKQSQVRIMGANSASQQLDKTDVLIDLVPLGDKFDYTTAYLTSQSFWHKQVVIKASYFGDYEILYVNYPGLPPSPPLPPSSISIIDGSPYTSNGNNGETIKPLGVDVHKRQHKHGLSSGVIAIIALSALVAVILCSAAAWVLLFKCRDQEGEAASTPRELPPSLVKAPGTATSVKGGGPSSTTSSFRSNLAAYIGSAKTFSLNDIEKATENFHDSRILGEGGFGCVYLGILEDGTKVAIKVLKREDHHGDCEFLAEVEMLSRLHHRNLVKLIGICAEDSFRCLVYELIPNGSVESHLHVDKEASPLNWGARLKIALGAARGLAYLHEDSSPRVIHRDFKSSNILLEDDFTPKVSDFGLARTAADGENRHISTRVMGTFGYVAPEYAMTGHLLVKSDVYSYGVVLLELLTGRKPVDMSQPPGQENLVAWARPLLTSKEGLETIIDPSLGSDVPFDSVAKVAAIASMCAQPEVSNRPFMGEVVQALKLVCNECDGAREEFSRSSSQKDLSVDMEMGASTVSGQLDNFQRQHSTTNYDSGPDIERGLAASEFFSSSARFERQGSRSFRRHSYSGPLRTGRSRRLWQIIRKLSGGSVSEHGTMFKL